MRYILLQARKPTDQAKHEEHHSFAKRLNVDIEQIVPLDIFSTTLDSTLLDSCDALLVGGAGEYSVLDNDPHIKQFITFLGQVCDSTTPMFASCFGFQALVLALGGSIIKDEANAEVGTYLLETTGQGEIDPLFAALPKQFFAQLGHQDRAEKLPSCVTHLARSERTEYQAFRVSGKSIYATQFHPELTFEDNRKRFARYMTIYGQLFGEEKAKERMDSHRPSVEANQLLSLFQNHIIES